MRRPCRRSSCAAERRYALFSFTTRSGYARIRSISPRISFTLDGRQLVAGNRENYDPLTKVSLGLDWRF